MTDSIIGSFYCWLFEDLFGQNLADYLWGLAAPLQTSNMFIPIGLTMLATSLVVMLVYYYVVNHPKLCNLWGWLIFLAVNFVINFVVGWQWVLSHLYAGKMVVYDENNLAIPLEGIDESNCLLFGLANALVSILAFIFFTYAFKWWSSNCRPAPENTFRRR